MPTFSDEFDARVLMQGEGTPLPDDEPFRILLAGNWSGQNAEKPALDVRHPLEIDRDNFAEIMWKLNVSLELDINGDGTNLLHLQFNDLDDFHPDSIFRRVSLFSDLRETRRRLKNNATFEQAAREVRDWIGAGDDEPSSQAKTSAAELPIPTGGNLLDSILAQTGETAVKKAAPKNELEVLIGKLVKPFLINVDENEQSKLVAAVDEATGELMRKILHNPAFQALEAAWRGAYLVTSKAETDLLLRIYIFDLSKEELAADLKTGELSDSVFCKLLGSEKPFAVVCGNYDFAPNVEDTATLMRVAKIARTFETPFVTHGKPDFFGAKRLAETPDSDDWQIAEDSGEAKLWAMLRALPEADALGFIGPRFMARLPYGEKSDPTETFSFEELSVPPKHDEYLWANPCFAFGLLLAKSYTGNGWNIGQRFFQDIESMPTHIYRENGVTETKPCTEVYLSQKTAEKMIEQGFMPLVSFRNSDQIRLLRVQSIAEPAKSLAGKW